MDVNKSPTPAMEYAAAVAAVVAFYGNDDPARPFQTLPLAGVLAPAESDRRTLQERNTLLYDGISTMKVVGGIVQLDRMITTYKTSASGAADTSYLGRDDAAHAALSALQLPRAHRLEVSAAQAGGRRHAHRRRSGGHHAEARQGRGDRLVPRDGRTRARRELRSVQDDLVVQRNASDRNRLDFVLPPDIVNPLTVTAARVDFRV
jgi:phage tail sheath gpL-like